MQSKPSKAAQSATHGEGLFGISTPRLKRMKPAHMISTKQQALDLFESKRKEFLTYLRWNAVRKVKETLDGTLTIDDVRSDVITPDGVDPRVYGAVFNTDDWEKIGYTQTSRKTSHARPIAVFRYRHFIPRSRKQVTGNLALF